MISLFGMMMSAAKLGVTVFLFFLFGYLQMQHGMGWAVSLLLGVLLLGGGGGGYGGGGGKSGVWGLWGLGGLLGRMAPLLALGMHLFANYYSLPTPTLLSFLALLFLFLSRPMGGMGGGGGGMGN
ncbi:hypothetical protein B484DRAFT_442024, partial [Ochromonadaceae sp. CCMP2298]